MRLARASAPLECVGLLAGPEPDRATELYPLRNVAPDPERRYAADPAGLIRALRAIRDQRLEVVAIYHSHPRGGTAPSRTDVEAAAWDAPYLIVDAVSGEMRAWRLLGGVREETLEP